MAHWNKTREQEKQRKRDDRVKAAWAALIARQATAIKMLEKHRWAVKVIEDGATWELKMPGAAAMICCGIESLERKTIGMK